ncbi:YggS family pyridoxal phosphate-dependent enzyme [SAR86 cluster bacterium]|nr:YggS family pyridoxal phosphate-dependent enzyme [SAR86 cluster bacterium]
MISSNLHKINQGIEENCKLSGRKTDEIILIGASKAQTIDSIREAYESGLAHFGENYLQEAEEKIKNLPKDLVWHYIGSIQSRKAKRIAEIFDWVHTVDSVKVAMKLNSARPKSRGFLNVCLQLNIDNEENKSGLDLKEIDCFIEQIKALQNLKIRGLMVIPRPREALEEQKEIFGIVKNIFSTLNEKGNNFDTLSMGMSSDYAAAIQEGATMIRVGTGIFGQRK